MECCPPPDGTIIIGQCRIPTWAAREHFLQGISLLPVALHSEINRYHRLEDCLARLVARLLIRKTFQNLDLYRESTLEHWCKDSRGRPFLTASDADISISHANPWVVSAVGFNCRVGIDVEVFQPLELEAFLTYFTQDEIAHIQQSSQPEVEVLHYWSRREAILKADGRGLLAPEKTIRNITSVQTPNGKGWRFESLSFSAGCLYLASDHPIETFRKEEWDFTELIMD